MNYLKSFSTVVLVFLLFTAKSQETFGPYVIFPSSGWSFNQGSGDNSNFVFTNQSEGLTIKFPGNPRTCNSADDFSKIIMATIQQLSSANEFVEQTKPSVMCLALGQKTSHLLVVKSRNTGERRLILSPVAEKMVYQIEISGNIPDFQIPPQAAAFLRNTGLGSGMTRINTENTTSSVEKTSNRVNIAAPVKSGEIEFMAPNEVLPPGTTLSAQVRNNDISILKDVVDPDKYEQLKQELKLMGVYELNPDGYVFKKPAQFLLHISEKDFPSGYSYDNLRFILLSNGDLEDAPMSRNGDQITVEIPHCSYLLAIGIPLIALSGSIALYMKGATEPMNRRDCAKWIDANNEKIREIAHDPKLFNINSQGDIFVDVGTKMTGMNVGQGNHFIKPGNFIKKPQGDCVNFSSLYGSFLAAKGYPVRLVAGNATYPNYSGGHQWVETVINGKAYYVDTYNPSKAKLVPLDIAKNCYKLNAGKMCYPDSPKTYNDKWYTDNLEPKSQLDLYYELRSQHRILQEFCAAGVAASCSEASEIYKQAMKIRKELEGSGVKVVE